MCKAASKHFDVLDERPVDVRRAEEQSKTPTPPAATPGDRKSTRLNSSHLVISYAVFCLKKNNRNGINYGPSHDVNAPPDRPHYGDHCRQPDAHAVLHTHPTETEQRTVRSHAQGIGAQPD